MKGLDYIKGKDDGINVEPKEHQPPWGIRDSGTKGDETVRGGRVTKGSQKAQM